MDFSKAVDLTQIAEMRKYEDMWGVDIVDLLPTERTTLMELQVDCRRSYWKLWDTIATDAADVKTKKLAKWAIDWDHQFRAKGFAVFVDPYDVVMDVDGNFLPNVEIAITGRCEASDYEFDFERAQGEKQAGLDDGIAGRIDEKGNWLDPKTIIS